MRILFVTMQYGRSYLQGTERYLATLGRCLRARGHEVGFLAGDPLGLDRRSREQNRDREGAGSGFRVRGSGVGEVVDSDESIFAYPTRGWMAVHGVGGRRLEAWLTAWRPDIVHVANPAHVGVGAATACRRLGIPLVVTTMDFWWVCPKATLLRPDGRVCAGCRGWAECIRCLAGSHRKAWARSLAKLPPGMAGVILAAFYAKAAARGMSPRDLGRWTRRNVILSNVLARADEVIFPSRATWEAIRPRFAHDRCRIIPYGLSSEWFALPRTRAEVAKPPEELVIGYAGALMPHKGPHLLLEAVRRLGWVETRIRLAGPEGDGGYVSRLCAAGRGLKVEFMGPVAAEAMPSFLRSLDLLVMTSVWPENLPFVVLEAQAGGVPVVASRLAGVAEQVGDERLLFEPGSVEGLAVALARAREDLADLRPGKVSTAEEMTTETEAVYARAMQRHQPEPIAGKC